MKRTLAGCLLTLGLLTAPLASASASTSVQKVHFETTLDACGESIFLSGPLLFTITEQQLHNGGSLFAFHAQPQGIRGTSSSGATYHANGLTRDISVVVPHGGFTETFINRFHIVGTAGAPTYYVRETTHITVSASGDVRVSIDNYRETCM